MRTMKILSAAALMSLALGACGPSPGNTEPGTDAGPVDSGVDLGPGFTQPSGTVAVNFTVDDTANKLFQAGELEWKGSMIYDPATRMVTKDDTWGGPYAPLFDDGPWNVGHTGGGHEPIGSTPNDHKWGVTVFVTPPATASTQFGYGLIDAVYQTTFGDGWIWPPPDGSFTVNAGATTPITAEGTTIPLHGTTDFQLILEKANLDPGSTWDTSKVEIKGSAWAWGLIELKDDGTKGDAAAGDDKFTFRLSEYVGAGKPFKHSGLLKSGNKPEWNFVLNGVEYKAGDGTALDDGIIAGTKATGATTFTTQTVLVAANKNTYITVP
jgi:hypothetical protein